MPHKRSNAKWWRTHLEPFFSPDGAAQEADTNVRRRVLDFLISSGKISARIQDEAGKIYRTEILCDPFADADWDAILTSLAPRSLSLASLLAGVLPPEIESSFREAGNSLFPSGSTAVDGRCECSMGRPCPHIVALWEKFLERLDEDPFSIFILRGRGRDETILELRRRRTLRRAGHRQTIRQATPIHERIVSKPLSVTDFYRARRDMFSLSYNIRADELPAAVLKWLEPIPVGDGAEDIDFRLEESYAQVARRAQGFGLGLMK